MISLSASVQLNGDPTRGVLFHDHHTLLFKTYTKHITQNNEY